MRKPQTAPNSNEKVWSKRASSGRWIGLAIAGSVFTTLVLIGGLVYGAAAAWGAPVGGKQPPSTGIATAQGSTGSSPLLHSKPKTLRLVALGDSLTHGYGDASGRGYVGDLAAELKTQGISVIASNLGVDGLTSAGLVQELKRPEINQLIADANLVLISIGGNDLNQAAGLPTLHADRITAAEKTFHANVTTILKAVRAKNPSAPILFLGLYNPFGDLAPQTDPYVEQWNTGEAEIAGQFANTVVVRTFDLFQFGRNQFLYDDHFHPNQAGYQRIADRMWQDLQGFYGIGTTS